jgi:deazaflavin-dependent oxidoreductase (nitroreductase family)
MAMADITQALSTAEELELTTVGRKSGRFSTRPVWFVKDGQTLYLLPVKGSDTEWYKNVLKSKTVRLAADGATLTAQAIPVTDPATVTQVVERFRSKYGADQVQKYYTKLDVAVKVPLAPAGGGVARAS